MNKYEGLNKITKKLLHGEICKMDIHYENSRKVLIHVEYKDDTFTYDYNMTVDKETLTTEFIGHHSLGILAGSSLSRNSEFEAAVSDYLMHY